MSMTKELWSEVPPEERKRRVGPSRRAMAVKTIEEQRDELTEDQVDRLIAAIYQLDDVA
jgi:hypothetical protein